MELRWLVTKNGSESISEPKLQWRPDHRNHWQAVPTVRLTPKQIAEEME